MQFVKTADLKPGMRLAKPIYNRMGVLLYERDTKLTIQGINSIQNFGLIGIFVLEPAEPLPHLSREDIEFEQLQTVYVFKLKDNMDNLQQNKAPNTLLDLVISIQSHYGVLDHKINFAQTLRSSEDFVYKRSISIAILTAMMANRMHVPPQERISLITATLLYNFGYLYVPKNIIDKGTDLEQGDLDLIHLNLQKSFEKIRPIFEGSGLPELSLDLIQYILNYLQTGKMPDIERTRHVLLDIVKVADRFDEMTAMHINQEPVSEMKTMFWLNDHKREYSRKVVGALAECIHILPTGACVDLSDGEKALVLSENPADFSHPMVLKFSNNVIYDLSDPAIAQNLFITDIMKTMDNRIAIDHDTVKQFTEDKYIKNLTERFHRQKEAIENRAKRRSNGKKT